MHQIKRSQFFPELHKQMTGVLHGVITWAQEEGGWDTDVNKSKVWETWEKNGERKAAKEGKKPSNHEEKQINASTPSTDRNTVLISLKNKKSYIVLCGHPHWEALKDYTGFIRLFSYVDQKMAVVTITTEEINAL